MECEHQKTRHSPNGWDIIEECPECCTAYLHRGFGFNDTIRLLGVYETRLIKDKISRGVIGDRLAKFADEKITTPCISAVFVEGTQSRKEPE